MREQLTREEWLAEKKRLAVERYNTLFAPVYDSKWGAVIDPTHALFVAKLAEQLQENDTVLDAACGTGKYWPLLRQHKLQVVGTDQSIGMLKNLKNKYPDGVVYQQSLQDLSLEMEFAGVLCIDAMENIPPEDWLHVLDRFKKHLMNNGWLYFTVEVEAENVLQESYERARSQGLPVVYGEVALEGYHYYPGEDAVRQWLDQAGFKIVEQDLGDGYRHYLCQI